MSSTRPIIVDDTDTRISYSGQGWFQDNGSQDQYGNYGPTYKHTLHGTTVSNSLSFSFRGTSVRVMGTTNLVKLDDTHYDPSWECFVDNVSIGSTSPFPYRENNWIMCSSGTLSDGSHELTVKITTTKGNTFWFDAVQYVPSPSDVYDTEVVVVDNHDSGIQWGTGWGSLGSTANMTTAHGSTVRFDFTGTSLSWVGFIPTELSHTSSSGSYSVDGGDPVSFTLNGLPADGKTTVYNQIFFTTPQLSPGSHSLLVTYNGDSQHTPLTLDYIYLTNKTILASSPSSSSGQGTGEGSSSSDSSGSSSTLSIGQSSSSIPVSLTSLSDAATKTFSSAIGSGSAGSQNPSNPSGYSSSTSSNPVSSNDTSSKTPVGAIIGGTLGGVIVLLLLALLIFCIRRRSRKPNRLNLIPPSDSGFAPFMSMQDNNLTTGFVTSPHPPPSVSESSYDPYGGYISPHTESSNVSSSQLAAQHSHRNLARNRSMSSEPSSADAGYNCGAAAATQTGLQPLRKERELPDEGRNYGREVVHHLDSGVRWTGGAHRVVEEVPPVYTFS